MQFKPPQKKRKAAPTAPSYHLTSKECMDFIEKADERSKEKDANEKKYNKIKEEAVKEAKAKERKEKKAKQAKSAPKPRSRKIPDHPRL